MQATIDWTSVQAEVDQYINDTRLSVRPESCSKLCLQCQVQRVADVTRPVVRGAC